MQTSRKLKEIINQTLTKKNIEIMVQNKKSYNLVIGVVALLAIILLIAVIGYFVSKPKPLVIQGEAEATEYRVSGKVPGRIETLFVKEGDKVKAGSLLTEGSVNPHKYLDINGAPAFKKGYSLVPDFWRAPTDNDYGVDLQKKFAAWKDPKMDLKKFECKEFGDAKQVVAEYDMPTVSAKLLMTYTLRPDGQLVVNEKLTTDPNAKEKPMMFRFGMQLVMPQEFSKLQYYGRGPGENYIDRHWGDRIGVYNQNVADQYWGYVRPQESGNHTDIRWWKVLSGAGTGLEFYSNIPMECSSLNYLTSDLDGGPEKMAHQMHSGDLTPRKFTVVKIQERQFGLGGIDSWSQWPEPEVQMPYGDREFTFVINPLANPAK